jgi:hypothetical protein
MTATARKGCLVSEEDKRQKAFEIGFYLMGTGSLGIVTYFFEFIGFCVWLMILGGIAIFSSTHEDTTKKAQEDSE